MVSRIVVLGGGTAGLTAALTLKLRVPWLSLRVIRSPDIGVIGVGEGTTVTFPQHFFEYLRIPPRRFFDLAEPTWKLGVRFLWGARPEFYYPFGQEYSTRWPGLARLNACYVDAGTLWLGPTSALMAHNKAFLRGPDGTPQWHQNFAFHVENTKLVGALETLARAAGVEFTDDTMREAERGPEGIAALHLETANASPPTFSSTHPDFARNSSGVSLPNLIEALTHRSFATGRSLPAGHGRVSRSSLTPPPRRWTPDGAGRLNTSVSSIAAMFILQVFSATKRH